MNPPKWVKTTAGTWPSLKKVDLTNVTAAGIYIIWYFGSPGRVVYVGQGIVKDRLGKHRLNPEITLSAPQGIDLLVSWATVPEHLRGGMERYLADRFNPIVGEAHPDVPKIAVLAPWEVKD